MPLREEGSKEEGSGDPKHTSFLYLSELMLQNVLEQHDNVLEVIENKVSIVQKRKPNEVFVSPYNTDLLSLLKSNMNLQFVTDM